MKAFLLVATIVIAAGSGAFAQTGGYIAPHPTELALDCIYYEQVGVTNSVFIVHTLTPQANTSQFKLDVSNWPAPVINVDYYSNLYLGDILTGVVVTYGACQPMPHVVARVDFLPLAASPICSHIEVVPDPMAASGHVEAVTCQYDVVQAYGQILWVNSDGTCTCIIGTEDTTWSQVKALYR